MGSRNAVALNPTVILAIGWLLALNQSARADARPPGPDGRGRRWLSLHSSAPGRRA